jgi:hypothetical protein
VTTSDVGHCGPGCQLVGDSIQRRDPVGQLGPVTYGRTTGAREQARVVVAQLSPVAAERALTLVMSMNSDPNAFMARATKTGELSSARAIAASVES